MKEQRSNATPLRWGEGEPLKNAHRQSIVMITNPKSTARKIATTIALYAQQQRIALEAPTVAEAK